MAHARAAQPHPVRVVRGASARRRLDRLPVAADRHLQTAAMGAGPHGDPRKRTSPSSWPPGKEPHPCRGSRCPRCAVGDGGGRKMLLPFSRNRRIVGRPARARFHRHAAIGGRVGTEQHAVLAGSAWWNSQPQWRADALADRKRSIFDQRSRLARIGNAVVGGRAVPRTRLSAGSLGCRA